MEREALRECVSVCSKRPAVFVSKFRGALQSLRKRSSRRAKAKGFKSAADWPSTPGIDGHVWNLAEPPSEAEPTGPSEEDAAWAAANLNGTADADDEPPPEYYDALADEAAALDRLERGLLP